MQTGPSCHLLYTICYIWGESNLFLTCLLIPALTSLLLFIIFVFSSPLLLQFLKIIYQKLVFDIFFVTSFYNFHGYSIIAQNVDLNCEMKKIGPLSLQNKIICKYNFVSQVTQFLILTHLDFDGDLLIMISPPAPFTFSSIFLRASFPAELVVSPANGISIYIHGVQIFFNNNYSSLAYKSL